MEKKNIFTNEEKKLILSHYRRIIHALGGSVAKHDVKEIRKALIKAVENDCYPTVALTVHPVIYDLTTALIVTEEIGLKRASVISVLLYRTLDKVYNLKEISKIFGNDVATIVQGLVKTNELYRKNAAVETENFRKLLMSFAEDVRVILIMIAERTNMMRLLNVHQENEDLRHNVAREASFLYAPLAHRLGLYKIKSELEDLSLKFLNRKIYTEIAKKLNETKSSRDKYIATFIEPIKKKLEESGFKFSIKGRTKSIYSIWNKIRKQNVTMDKIYDLFAIRIILDSDLKKEKAECWQVYSIVTDMYQPNPKRLRDWLSIPKSNGYESLHITVMGPEGKWVEVQIRTQRMDEIAEQGLAAHWKYKGLKNEESGFDAWLANIRDILENSDSLSEDLMHEFKLDLYDKEVFVFTPKGELKKMAKGATILDFAFDIHSGLGSKCVGGIVNGKNVPLKYVLKNGDQVEILTSPSQKPKMDWLGMVITSKARHRIKQTLKEEKNKEAEFGKEILQRRFKNRKIEWDDATQMRLIKKMGYKTVTDFMADIASEKQDVNHVIEFYLELTRKDSELSETSESRKAENFNVNTAPEPVKHGKEDVLVIDNQLKNIDFKLAKCCSPIYGDEIFGFISSQGGIRVHRCDCPNAPDLISRYGYRIVKAKWAGKSGSQYSINLHVIGHDDIGIVTNITSLISKEENVSIRSMNLDSHDGLFQGTITVLIGDTSRLDSLIKKIKTVKGIKQVSRVGGL